MEIKYTPGIFITLLVILIVTSCKKEEVSYLDRPVVEAYLMPGQEALVKVYYQKDLNDTTAYGVRVGGLSINLSDGVKFVKLTEDSTGYYRVHDKNFIVIGKSYSLSFDFSGIAVSAETTVPAKPTGFTTTATEVAIPDFTPGTADTTFKSVRLNWKNADKSNFMIVFRNQEQSPTAVNSRFTTDDPVYDTEVDAGTAAYYDIQRTTFLYLGSYKAVLLHVNSEYKDMLQNNGTSSQNLTNPPTNIKNGLGIFTAMSADTLSLTVIKK